MRFFPVPEQITKKKSCNAEGIALNAAPNAKDNRWKG